jgi:murein DD-endopeptidase MepM/ murein hydrolase activator NlpD
MRELNQKLRKFFNRKLTFMVVPHHSLRSFHFQFSIGFALFLFILWTGLTSWATWAVTTNVDYWTTKVNQQVLKLKVLYFAQELKKSRKFLEQVRQADIQLRQLLDMKTKQSIIEEEQGGQGGPEPFERSILTKTLNSKLWDISNEEIRLQSSVILKDSQDQLHSVHEILEHIAQQRSLYRSTPRGWPAEGRMTSHFGYRLSPISGLTQFHSGIDIANARGTRIRATADGIVRHADWEGGYGRLIAIDHGFGYMTFYGHNSDILVSVGQVVKRGQVIGRMGSSGSSTGDHVHYEIWRNGQCINPWRFIAAKTASTLNKTY